jgi:hypothetical protein
LPPFFAELHPCADDTNAQAATTMTGPHRFMKHLDARDVSAPDRTRQRAIAWEAQTRKRCYNECAAPKRLSNV